MLRFNPRKSRLCKLKTCRARFIPKEPWEWWCCVEHMREIAVQKREAAQRKETREWLKRRRDWINDAQTAFNAFIRERDRDMPCICCGRPLLSDSVGGGYDCGHYRSVGSAPHLRFDERNAHGQTKQCNRYGAGRAVDYRIGLVARYGSVWVESLEADNTPRKWTIEELKAIRDLYRQKTKELKATR